MSGEEIAFSTGPFGPARPAPLPGREQVLSSGSGHLRHLLHVTSGGCAHKSPLQNTRTATSRLGSDQTTGTLAPEPNQVDKELPLPRGGVGVKLCLCRYLPWDHYQGSFGSSNVERKVWNRLNDPNSVVCHRSIPGCPDVLPPLPLGLPLSIHGQCHCQSCPKSPPWAHPLLCTHF